MSIFSLLLCVVALVLIVFWPWKHPLDRKREGVTMTLREMAAALVAQKFEPGHELRDADLSDCMLDLIWRTCDLGLGVKDERGKPHTFCLFFSHRMSLLTLRILEILELRWKGSWADRRNEAVLWCEASFSHGKAAAPFGGLWEAPEVAFARVIGPLALGGCAVGRRRFDDCRISLECALKELFDLASKVGLDLQAAIEYEFHAQQDELIPRALKKPESQDGTGREADPGDAHIQPAGA